MLVGNSLKEKCHRPPTWKEQAAWLSQGPACRGLLRACHPRLCFCELRARHSLRLEVPSEMNNGIVYGKGWTEREWCHDCCKDPQKLFIIIHGHSHKHITRS